ncbi:hypothetical protein [Mumia zhuanghuii]|uniref:Sensor domain-containing protein n=1 Tax=Mumia zhuanghuii TaxID=2585211 RepID=A0A5C4N4Q5_9ACTN|nr:hypothetical protein [Mumia zhuanghuii]TNC52600.1 hypothetical protein FHE65_00405 [Mumia zhuanghuii]TNC52666.1 hypothetical protein FHE65_00060 [Mumia zhuanghuii]
MLKWRSGGGRVLLPLAALPLLLTGCGGGESDAASTLSEEQLESVLVTLEDRPDGFVPVSGGGTGGGADVRASMNDAECLAGLDLANTQKAPKAEAGFNRANVLPITSTATSYPNDDIAASFDETADALASCADFEVSAGDGSGLKGTLQSDDTTASDDVDALINVRLIGTQQPSRLPVEITFGFARIGNDVVSVSAEGLGGPSGESFQDLMRATTDRLVAAREG